MKILIFTDTFVPDINGVATTLNELTNESRKLGHEVLVISPQDFSGFQLPHYPEIKVAIPYDIEGLIRTKGFIPDKIHIATESSIGLGARHWCKKNNYKFTTSFHTDFAAYFNEYVGIPKSITWGYLKWFHSSSDVVFVSNEYIYNELSFTYNFSNLKILSRGVNEQFKPSNILTQQLSRETLNIFGFYPQLLYVGRIAKEKNLEEFCRLSEYYDNCRVVGLGPLANRLAKQYPKVIFTGPKKDEELVLEYQNSDVFIFPSLTDTFGVVMLESMACGTPVIARRGMGVIKPGINGFLYNDDNLPELNTLIEAACKLDRSEVAATVSSYKWENVAKEWLELMVEK